MSNKAQAQRLIESEKRWGQPMAFAVSPLKDGKVFLYDGHQRYSSWLTVYGEDYEVDARQSDIFLTEEERLEFVVTMHAGATGSWDWQKLSSFPAPKLIDMGFDTDKLKDWNNNANNLKELLNSEKIEPVDVEPQIDRAAELAEKWQTKSGQLWKLGDHRLLVGDCTVRENVERLMGGERADLVVTSPPYNQGNNWGEFLGSSDKKMYAHSEDDMSEAEYSEFIFLVLNRCFEIVNDIHTIAWNVAYNAKSRDSYGKILFSDKNPFTVKETIVWDKHSAINLTAIGIYSRRCEFVFIMSSGDKYLTNQKKGEARWNYWETKKPQQLEGHRATFPVEFAERPIFELSFEKNIVYEPFAGSGTTIIAAHNLNRRCYAMEISEKYGAVILERFFTATGIKPELVTE